MSADEQDSSSEDHEHVYTAENFPPRTLMCFYQKDQQAPRNNFLQKYCSNSDSVLRRLGSQPPQQPTIFLLEVTCCCLNLDPQQKNIKFFFGSSSLQKVSCMGNKNSSNLFIYLESFQEPSPSSCIWVSNLNVVDVFQSAGKCLSLSCVVCKGTCVCWNHSSSPPNLLTDDFLSKNSVVFFTSKRRSRHDAVALMTERRAKSCFSQKISRTHWDLQLFSP